MQGRRERLYGYLGKLTWLTAFVAVLRMTSVWEIEICVIPARG